MGPEHRSQSSIYGHLGGATIHQVRALINQPTFNNQFDVLQCPSQKHFFAEHTKDFPFYIMNKGWLFLWTFYVVLRTNQCPQLLQL